MKKNKIDNIYPKLGYVKRYYRAPKKVLFLNLNKRVEGWVKLQVVAERHDRQLNTIFYLVSTGKDKYKEVPESHVHFAY